MAKKNNKKSGNKVTKMDATAVSTVEQVVTPAVETPAETPVEESKVETTAETPKETPKVEKPKVEKPVAKPEKKEKAPKVEKPIVEEVVVESVEEIHDEQKPKSKQEPTVAALVNVGSLSPDGRVGLLTLVERQYLNAEVKETHPELYLSMRGYFDFGVAYTIIEDMQFLQEEGLKKGLAIDVAKLAEFMEGFKILGVSIDKKKLPAPVDGQQVIPFETINISAETKKDIKETQAVKEELREHVILNPKEIAKLPSEEREEEIRKTLKHFLTEGNPYKALFKTIGWYKSVTNETEIPIIIQAIHNKVGMLSPLKVMANGVFYGILGNRTPFSSHCIVKKYIERFDDREIAQTINGLLNVALEIDPKRTEKGVFDMLKMTAESIETLMNKRTKKGVHTYPEAAIGIVTNTYAKDLGNTEAEEYKLNLINKLVEISNAYYPDETIHKFESFSYKN